MRLPAARGDEHVWHTVRGPAAALAILLVLAGCGGNGDGDRADGGEDARPAEGGTLSYALDAHPAELDPLYASERAEKVVTRQIHEPLTASLTGPFGDVREVPGLAQSVSASQDETIWRLRLRSRVSFQDGSPFNAAAVLANTDRWLGTPEGRDLLEGLSAVDAPRPDLVRFILGAPDSAFPDRLAQPRLGIVSPRALRAAARRGGTVKVDPQGRGTGTGAFELREHDPDSRTLLVRNVEWWGSRLDLGPALDQISFPVVADVDRRIAMLEAGEIQVADALGSQAVTEVRADPLLAVSSRSPGPAVGFERSVRGIASGESVPVLSGTWLTTVGVGE